MGRSINTLTESHSDWPQKFSKSSILGCCHSIWNLQWNNRGLLAENQEASFWGHDVNKRGKPADKEKPQEFVNVSKWSPCFCFPALVYFSFTLRLDKLILLQYWSMGQALITLSFWMTTCTFESGDSIDSNGQNLKSPETFHKPYEKKPFFFAPHRFLQFFPHAGPIKLSSKFKFRWNLVDEGGWWAKVQHSSSNVKSGDSTPHLIAVRFFIVVPSPPSGNQETPE